MNAVIEIPWIDFSIDKNVSKLRVHDRDRIIYDVLKNMGKMDKEIFNKVIQRNVNDLKKNIPNLMMYAKKLDL